MPEAVTEWLKEVGDGPIVGTQVLGGGQISLTRRLATASGRPFVLKTARQENRVPIPPDLYQREAEGLAALAQGGFLRVPAVYLLSPRLLLLEDLGTWTLTVAAAAQAGRSLGFQHRHRSPRFGFDTDNYLGLVPQRNNWTDDGHAFFAQHRILRYLEVPRCFTTLSPGDRRRLEQLASRLTELVPSQPACLLHGDLWRENLLMTAEGEPAVVDPAVHCGWPEAELSMIWSCGGIPDEFFAAYFEANPLEPGWQDRMTLLHIREVLSMIAHFGPDQSSLRNLAVILDKFT